MKILSALLLSFLLCAAAWPQIHVQVEPADTTQIKKPSPTLDQTGLADAVKMDAVARTAELQLRPLSRYLHPDFPDEKLVDSTRKQIADVMAQEMIALWDFQVDRALQYHDTALLSAMQAGLDELARNPKMVEAKIKAARKKMDKLMEPK
jgi:hypothetical protein